MNKTQIALIVFGGLAVFLIYMLPRTVVENDTLEQVSAVSHEMAISESEKSVIQSLKSQIAESNNIKKTINFADSLANLYLKYQFVDSADRYAGLIASLDTTVAGQYRVAMIHYNASQVAKTADEAKDQASEAKRIFDGLLQKDPTNVDLKNKLAMTLMTSDNPMQGVMMLREVLEENPENREAIFNLGLLAIRSGQYDRALDRFKKLIDLDANDFEAVFYLGVVYSELGQNQESIEQFRKYIEYEGAEPALKATASDYIKELESI